VCFVLEKPPIGDVSMEEEVVQKLDKFDFHKHDDFKVLIGGYT